MDPDRWQQVDKLLEQALEHEPRQRPGFLDDACGKDSELRHEVESLLAAHERAGNPLSSPPLAVMSRIQTDSLQSLTGHNLGHYQILSRLGEGGMGIVYKARDTHLDRFVAIKVLPPQLLADLDRKKRFVLEAKAASALNHPNIITIHDIAQESGYDFIVMEYVAGKTLGESIPRRGLKLSEALKYAIQIADALAKAHAAGIIHRDVKPGNIMISEGGMVKLLDFGLAKLTENQQLGEDLSTSSLQPRTEQGMILGTASYMSPEQADGRPVDARSDIFSFGSVLYEMVTGQTAFHGDSTMSTLAAVLNQDPKAAGEISSSLPHDLEKIISRCLRKDPSRRFQHMDDVRLFLQEVLETTAAGETSVIARPDQRRFPRLMIVGGLFAFLIALALAVWIWRSLRKSDGSPMIAVPLTTYPGHERSPSFSPDGNQVVFSWDGERQDNFDIYVKLIGADGPPLRLTTDSAEDTNPVWSPDGRWIAFLRNLANGRAEVLRISPIGGAEKKLGEVDKQPWSSFAVSFPLTWSPNGDSLVIADRESDSEPYALFLLSVESGVKHRLTSPPTSTRGDTGPSFSPDGRTLAFVRMTASESADLYFLPIGKDLMALAEPKRLTTGRRRVSGPAWAPDGQEVVFSDFFPTFSVSRFGNLWKVSITGAGESWQVPVGENALGLTISRPRHRLVYSREVCDVNIWRVDISGPPAKVRNLERFILSTRDESNPQISPDGKKVVFSSNRSGAVEIWVCDQDGSSPMQLTSFGSETASPRWSPDSRWVTFDSNIDGQTEIYAMDTKGGRPLRLTSHPAADQAPSWSRDGKSIYFGSNRSGTYQVWKMSASGGAPLQVTQKGGYLSIESPDGQTIYYMKGRDDTRIWKVPSQGGEEVEVLSPIFRRDFDVTKDGIYFISEPDLSKSQFIRFLSFSTGKIKSIAAIQNAWGHFITVSPDGRWILYPKLDLEGSDLMLVENFR